MFLKKSFTLFLFPALLCKAPAFFGFSVCAAPTVSVSALLSEGAVVFDLSATDLPELRSITLDCVYNPQLVAIMRSVVAAPLPATGLGLAVDTAGSTVKFSISAMSTILIQNGSVFMTLKVPAQTQNCLSAIVFTAANITDKSGANVVASIYCTGIRHARPLRTALPGVAPMRRPIQRMLLNGRCFPADYGQISTGCVVTVTGVSRQYGIINLR